MKQDIQNAIKVNIFIIEKVIHIRNFEWIKRRNSIGRKQGKTEIE
jgi:hypothetical protein